MDVNINDIADVFWRWGTYVQTMSTLLLVVFFVVLARQVGSRELRCWAAAWSADLVALAVVSAFWMTLLESPTVLRVSFGAYVLFKCLFALLIMRGTLILLSSRHERLVSMKRILGISLASGLLAIWISGHSVLLAGLTQGLVVTLGFGGLAVYLLRVRLRGAGWLAIGLGMRALLGLRDVVGNVALKYDWPVVDLLHLRTVSGANSSLDAIAEFAIALFSLLLLSETFQRDLRVTNARLSETRERLQELVRRDPLTGLLNRHVLDNVAEHYRETGADVLFLDIDGFKEINDSLGHDVGDACLVRFARALEECFDGEAQHIRYAGDEFLVLTPPRPAGAAERALACLRGELSGPMAGGLPDLQFSVGLSRLGVDESIDPAIRRADQAMYEDKRQHPRGLGPGTAR